MIYKSTNIKMYWKGVFLSTFLFIVTANAVAQEPKIGIKGGLNYSTIAGDLTEGINPRLSGHLGVYLNFEFTDKFSIQPELLYSSQGFRYNTDLATIQSGVSVNNPDFTTAVQLNYLAVPLIVQFELSNRVDLELGPQFAFLLNQVSKVKNFDGTDEQIEEERVSIAGDFQLDYGLAVGVAFNVNEAISISPRLYLGLRNRLNGLGGNLQNYNGALQLSVNYTL